MEEQCSPLSFPYHYQEEVVQELNRSLLYSSMELEAALVSAFSDISRRDAEILRLKRLLAAAINERDELHARSRDLALENQLLFQQLKTLDSCRRISSSNDGDRNRSPAGDRSPSDSDENSSIDGMDVTDRVVVVKGPLAEQGRFLQAVMEAGPLLQNLLLAGPLPRWQHPPPQLDTVDIPPVAILARDFSPSPKYPRVCSPVTIEP